ncbi:DinB family protein [Filimonas effusa]|uniref:DUF1572 domain-containing protein n=1 Tax=Filimonas effusa TaxID=2508721 RepID=A0A4V1MA46_9BACT|nr:DinB family protein [Filimonas effusa]RXK83904.1 DUF1572 domain-containing protein [Filimonas effusa]
MTTQNTAVEAQSFISSADLLNEWIGHRRLTRKAIEAFPEDQFFTYSIGGMRPFAIMVKELIDVSVPGIEGIVTDKWNTDSSWEHSYPEEQRTKAHVLALWDKGTETIIERFPQISEERFRETIMAFGQFEGTVYSTVLYFIDNEVHHRAQGYVYLRSLGIEPPAFWDRN